MVSFLSPLLLWGTLLGATYASRPSTNERRSSTSTIRACVSGTTAPSFAPALATVNAILRTRQRPTPTANLSIET